MNPPRTITVYTHHVPEDTREALEHFIEVACERGVELRFPPAEVEKHGLGEREGCVLGADPEDPADLAVVFGGDGTILGALRSSARHRTPVFAFNYGAIGFLATVDRDGLETGIDRALGGDFEVIGMPALELGLGDERPIGVNDISFQRRGGNRVAMLEYSVGREQLGMVRCDGLVAATPVGSTGYNLANGGPVLAWGVEGYVVSFIAPHTLTARALVVAPDDPLTVANVSEREPVDVTTDGRPVAALPPGGSMELRFTHDRIYLAQVDGATFYHRFRDKFGRLAY